MLGLVPDTALTNSAISACDRGGQWETALKLWMEMSHRDNISYRCDSQIMGSWHKYAMVAETAKQGLHAFGGLINSYVGVCWWPTVP